ncbi:hypothetical protein GYA25_02065 [Candidatus Woesearchaeota archaeon]|jgi:hypothetical protein|nr:hypothetical protein [Candidatus Woesearchaeota archaeon]
MKFKEYHKIIDSYPIDSEFLIKIDRGNGPIEREVILKYDELSKNKEFYFKESMEKLDLRLVGGIENILSLEEIPDGIC